MSEYPACAAIISVVQDKLVLNRGIQGFIRKSRKRWCILPALYYIAPSSRFADQIFLIFFALRKTILTQFQVSLKLWCSPLAELACMESSMVPKKYNICADFTLRSMLCFRYKIGEKAGGKESKDIAVFISFQLHRPFPCLKPHSQYALHQHHFCHCGVRPLRYCQRCCNPRQSLRCAVWCRVYWTLWKLTCIQPHSCPGSPWGRSRWGH